MHFLLLQATDSTSMIMQMLPFILILFVFYFFIIRPQSKKAREQQEYIESLKKGDNVVTAGGIYGKIVKVDDLTVLLEVDNNVRLKMDKATITAPPAAK